ncbi:MAG: hypothetical protein VCD00_08365, partial [Candidatus Hydrogenedentota bacterium]
MLKKIGLVALGCFIFALGAIVVDDFESYAKVVHAEKMRQAGDLESMEAPVQLVFSVRNHTFATTTVLPEYRLAGHWGRVENSEVLFQSSELISSMDEGEFEIEGMVVFDEDTDAYTITCVGNISTERVENANTNLTDRTNAPQSEVISSMDSFVLEFEASTI